MLTPLEAYKLHRYKAAIGEMTASEALALAISDEQIACDLSPFDTVKSRFLRSKEEMLNYAILLEKESNGKKGT